MLAETEPLRNLRYRAAPLGDPTRRVALELFRDSAFAPVGLLASVLGKKASPNLGAIHTDCDAWKQTDSHVRPSAHLP